MRALRIPLLVDLVSTSDPGEIAILAADPRLDRGFDARAPLVNRLVVRRIRRVLSLRGRPLPPVAPAADPERAASQARLETRLAGAVPDPQSVTRLAEHVLGTKDRVRLEVECQQAIGRLFDPAYLASPASFRAAVVLDGSVRGFVSPRAWLWKLTGRLSRSRKRLSDMVEGDPAAVHATGIAVHNLVQSVERLRALAATPGAFARYAPLEAATICLAAPSRVLRQAVRSGGNEAGSFRQGTLVALGLEAGRAKSLRPEIALMRGAWSQCPAHRWVPRLLAAVWQQAGSR